MAKFIQAQSFTLYGSGVIAGATSMVLSSFQQIDGTNITNSNIGTYQYMTIEPGSAREESIRFTGITQNANGTATLTGISTLLLIYPYTATSGFGQSHAGGATAILSNTASFYTQFGALDNAQTWSAVNTFTATPISTNLPTTPTQIVNKQYADSLAIAGAPNASTSTQGLVQQATNAELEAGTGTGSTTAPLFADPATLKASYYGDTVINRNTQYAVDTSVTDAYAITLDPAPTAYADGMKVSFKPATTNVIGASINVNSLGAISILNVDGSVTTGGQIVAGKVYDLEYIGGVFQLMSPSGVLAERFGGDGSDGMLTVSSGTTTIDLSSQRYVILNYSSISITGTGKVNFSNPHTNGTVIAMKSTGNVTITSSTANALDLSGIGASASTAGQGFLLTTATPAGTGSTPPSGTAGVNASGNYAIDYRVAMLISKNIRLSTGAGGASGGNGGSGTVAGTGGRGGGGLVIECAGYLNFTTANGISVAGVNGNSGNTAPGGFGGSGGGGGGAGGSCLVLYNYLTANTGTVVISGGTGGTGGTGNVGVGGAGGAGGSGGNGMTGSSNSGSGGQGGSTGVAQAGGGGGGGGASDFTGSNGSNGSIGAANGAGAGGGGGGGGASGWSYVTKNTYFT